MSDGGVGTIILGTVIVRVFHNPHGPPIVVSDENRVAEWALRGYKYCEHVVNLADLNNDHPSPDDVDRQGALIHKTRCEGRPITMHTVKVAYIQDGLRTDVCWAQRVGDQQEHDGICGHEIEAASVVEAERLAVYHHIRDCQ